MANTLISFAENLMRVAFAANYALNNWVQSGKC